MKKRKHGNSRQNRRKQPVNRKHKDHLFHFAFQDKKDLLDLYNAINETDYEDPDELEKPYNPTKEKKMKYIKADKLKELAKDHKLDTTLVIWGAGKPSGEIITWLYENGYGSNIKMIVDNFKTMFYKEYQGVPVMEPDELLSLEPGTYTVLMALSNPGGGGMQAAWSI